MQIDNIVTPEPKNTGVDNEQESYYQARENEFAIREQKKIRHLRSITYWRLGFFLLAFILPFVFSDYSYYLSFISFVTFIACFFWAVRKDVRLTFRRNLYRNYREINRKERLALKADHSQFPTGDEYQEEEHPFSEDLDVFGIGSLFQLIDRTGSKTGQKRLANWLLNPLMNIEEIKIRQTSIKELAKDVEWRQYFQAVALMHQENENDFERIQKWGKQSFFINKRSLWQKLTLIIPIITTVSGVLFVLDYTSSLVLSVCVTVQIISWKVKNKSIERIGNEFGKNAPILSKYALLMELVEKKEFESPQLQKLKNKLEDNGCSIVEIRKLKKAIDLFDRRNVMFVGQLLNVFLMHDIRCVIRLSIWHQKNGAKLESWLEALSEFDALMSLANFTYNNSDFTFPQLVQDTYCFEAKEMGHPNIHHSVRVNNNLNISGKGCLEIITGANMAGKSTFLRAVGVNMLLAMVGAPVCASEMKFSPILLYTHMRTSDNLAKKESYFYAELKHLSSIIDALNTDHRVFVILDEILRGTNSIDKLNGSKGFVRQLIGKGAVGLVATHDLELTKLSEKYPENVTNRCFEVELNEKELAFDYLLKPGVTQTMNATFLMKKMGIIVEDLE